MIVLSIEGFREMNVNEGSTATIVARPYDEDGDQLTPATARWKMTDLASNTEQVAWTALTPDSEMDIVISATDNTILDASKKKETKVVTVQTDYGTSSQHSEEFEYDLINLNYVP